MYTMRITCDVDTANRLLPSFNMKQKGKAAKSQVSVGRKPGSKEGEIMLLVCTKQNRSGVHYKLKDNVQQCFTKFVSEGKATLRLKEPPFDLCISKADPVQLKSLLSVVKLAVMGKNIENITLSSLAPVSTKQVEKLKSKLCITNRRDYPITKGFPSCLEVLHVNGCCLKKIDTRIQQLRWLRTLDLSSNSLRCLPDSWDSMDNLTELKLSENLLEDIPKGLCSGRIANQLCSLDISKNKLRILRPYFCQLVNLNSLKLDENELVCLPQHIGHLQKLQFLSVTNNKLKTLPATFGELRLESLDLFNNEFLADGPSSAIDKLGFPSLLECSARAIVKLKVPYTEEDVGHFVNLLNSPKQCLCGGSAFLSYVHYLTSIDLHRITAGVTAIDILGRTQAPAEAFLCSRACFERYKKNPRATIWK